MNARARPIANRVVVKVLDEERSGIWLPNGARGQAARGIVLDVGDEVAHVERADEILFPTCHAVEFKLEGETLYVLQERDVLVVVETTEILA